MRTETDYRVIYISAAMNKLKQYSNQLVTAATPLPLVIRKPGLVKLWLLNVSGKRLYLLIGLLVLFFAVSPVSESLVDFWYPAKEKTFKNTLSGMFNPKARKAAEELRKTRYQQLIFFFLGLGLSSAVILLLLDLPGAVRKGEQQAQKLLQQSLSIQSSNPELADTLANTAYKLMLQPTGRCKYINRTTRFKQQPGRYCQNNCSSKARKGNSIYR